MIHLLGGQCRRAETREYGKVELTHNGKSPLFEGVCPATAVYWMSHGVEVETLAPGFERHRAPPRAAAYAAIAERRKEALRRAVPPRGAAHRVRHRDSEELSLYGICGFAAEWTMASYLEEAVAECRAKVGSGQRAAGALRRRGQLRGRRAAAARGGRSAHLHLRGSRPAAQGRGRSGRARSCTHQFHVDVRRACERAGALSHQAGRRHRAGAQAQDHRRGVHPRL